VSHRNAPLTPQGRLLLCRRIEAGSPIAHVAKAMGISRRCASKWWHRYLALGPDGLGDRSSRPLRSPTRLSVQLEDKICRRRLAEKAGPDRLAIHPPTPANPTAHARLPAGSTATTITACTPPSAVHPPAASPTSRPNTTRSTPNPRPSGSNLGGGVTRVPSTLDGWRVVPMKMTGTDVRDRVRRSRLTLGLTTATGSHTRSSLKRYARSTVSSTSPVVEGIARTSTCVTSPIFTSMRVPTARSTPT
jgi:leucine-zipper of insertion element IS481